MCIARKNEKFCTFINRTLHNHVADVAIRCSFDCNIAF